MVRVVMCLLATTSHVAKGQVLEALAAALVVGGIAAAGHWARDEGVFPFRSRARRSKPVPHDVSDSFDS